MKLAIIGGTGREGPGLALRWAAAGLEVIIGSRQQEKAQGVAAELNRALGREAIGGMVNREAAAAADLVVMTVPFSAHVDTLREIQEGVRGKILVDVSVPLDPSNPKRLKMPEAGSAVEEAQALLGRETRVVGALQNISSHHLKDPSKSIDSDVLVCGDDEQARTEVRQLVGLLGLRALDCGPAEQARVIEGVTALLMELNARYKVRGAGIRITGIKEPARP